MDDINLPKGFSWDDCQPAIKIPSNLMVNSVSFLKLVDILKEDPASKEVSISMKFHDSRFESGLYTCRVAKRENDTNEYIVFVYSPKTSVALTESMGRYILDDIL